MKKILIILIISIISFSGQAALIHQYDFSTGAIDLIGSEDGTLLNGANINAGAVVLDGTNDYVQFSTSIIPTGDFSIAFNARQDSNQSGFVEIISQEGGRFYIGHSNSRIIRSGDSWINTGVAYPSDGLFHHFVLVADTSIPQTRLYIDGVLQAMTGVAVPVSAGGSNTRLGRQFGAIAEYFNGAIDDLNVYDNALSNADVNLLFFGPPAIVPLFSNNIFILLLALIGIVGLIRVRAKT